MSTRTRAVVALVVLAALVIAGALVDRSRRGLEISYMSLVILLSAPALRLWLVARGRIESFPPLPALGFSLVAFAGVRTYPFSVLALAVGALGTFWLALPAQDVNSELATRAEEAPSCALALATPIWMIFKWIDVDDVTNYLLAGVFACLVLESWGPLAEQTVEAACRRSAAFAILLAAVIVNTPGQIPLPPGIIGRPSADLLALAATAVLTACVEASDRSKPAPSSPPAGPQPA